MNYLSHPFFVTLRNAGRVLGINSLIARVLSTKTYEDAFDKELNALIKEGDIIWDIGANVGYYSQKFSKLTGTSGFVYAFEPSLKNLGVLHQAVDQLPNIKVMPFALGDSERTVQFIQGEDDLGATSSITEKTDPNSSIEVNMYSGSAVVSSGLAPLPNVIKIDVEGFEYEVILGLAGILQISSLRAIGIEIHFGLLNNRSLNFAPKKIEKMLQSAGFIVRWPDTSHIIACRQY